MSKKKIKFIITGSNSRLLSSEFVTLLSGRTTPVEVYPFSFCEFMQARGAEYPDAVALTKHRHKIRNLMDDYLQFGGFPEIAFLKHPDTIREIHAMYARSILYQDIAARFGVKKPVDLENLVKIQEQYYALLFSKGGQRAADAFIVKMKAEGKIPADPENK